MPKNTTDTKGKGKGSETAMKKKGRSEGEGGGSKNTVGSSLLLNKGQVKTGTFTAAEKADVEKDKRLSSALIGYSKFDVVTNKSKMTFRRWNDRDLIKDQVNKLVTSFMVDGVNRFKVANAIPVAIRKEDVKAGSYGSDGHAMEDLKYMELTLDAQKRVIETGQSAIIVASGQHRIAALEQYHTFLGKAKKESVRGMKALEKTKLTDVDDMEIDEENKIAKPKRDEIDGSIAFGGEWIVIIYDLDKLDYELGLHLSRNQYEHVYKESPEEGLVQKFKMHSAKPSPKNDWKSVPTLAVSKGTAYKQNDLLRMDYAWAFLDKFVPMGTQIFDRKGSLKLAPLHSTMMGPSGGVLTYFCDAMEKVFRMCFNAKDMDFEDIPQDDAAASALMLKDLRRQVPIVEAVLPPIRDIVNAAFVEHLGPGTSASHVFACGEDVEWSSAFWLYVETVVSSVSDTVDELERSGEIAMMGLSDEAKKAVHNCAPKMQFVLSLANWNDEQGCMFPFMCRAVYSHMESLLDIIPDALTELSMWFSPYLAYKDLHPPPWNPGADTAELRRVVLSHPDIKPSRRIVVLHSIMLSIWYNYPAYINLQRQLTQMNIPTRPKKVMELHALFGYLKRSAKKVDGSDTDVVDDDVEEEEIDDEPEDIEGVMLRDSDANGADSDVLREERAKKRAERDSRDAELKALHNDVTTIINACSKYKKDASRKDPKTNIPDINGPWSRASKLTGEAVNNARFPGKHTWRFHTAEYSAISLSSYYRHMPTLAAMILAEASAVLSYRPALIMYQPDGGAAFLRNKFEHDAARHLVSTSSTSSTLVQKTLSLGKQKNVSKWIPQDYHDPPPGTLTWPDGIYNPTYVECAFSLEQELTDYHRETKLVHQQRALQKAVDYIVTVPSAWADCTGALKFRDKPALHTAVVTSLVNLVETMSDNAYVQRQYPHDDDFDPLKSRNQEEKLRIDVPGHTAARSTSIRYMESRAFYVYTRKEANDLLHDLRQSFLNSVELAQDGSELMGESETMGSAETMGKDKTTQETVESQEVIQQAVEARTVTPRSDERMDIDDPVAPPADEASSEIASDVLDEYHPDQMECRVSADDATTPIATQMLPPNPDDHLAFLLSTESLAKEVAALRPLSHVSTSTGHTPEPDTINSDQYKVSALVSSDNDPILHKRDASKSLSSVDEAGTMTSHSFSLPPHCTLTTSFPEPPQKKFHQRKKRQPDPQDTIASHSDTPVPSSSTAPNAVRTRASGSRAKSARPASSNQLPYVSG
ncbi:hypothetical protein JVU11DRAFT_8205 [Chiua virens]|nr:hypothetical protein JVU11DRAFT_8205 [Chiua virens]